MNREQMIAENKRRQAELRADIEERALRFEPLVRERPRSTQRSTPMTTQPDWSDWDRWAKAHVQNGTDVLARVIGEEVGAIERRLAERITALEVELAILRGEAKGESIDLPRLPLRGRSNAA